VSLHLLGANLVDLGDPTAAEAVLREAQRLYPGDVWLNYALARCLEQLARREEAIRYYMAARSLRPETAHELAHTLEEKGESDQAIAVFQDLARLRPKDSLHLGCLGRALQGRGRAPEAKAALDGAIAAARAAIGLKRDNGDAHRALGNTLFQRGNLDEAIAEYREAIHRKPDYSRAHENLGNALYQRGNLDEAIAQYREAVRLRPDGADAHSHLGTALREQGKLDEAIAEYREAVRLRPDLLQAHADLGLVFRSRDQFAEAIAELRKARDLAKANPAFAQRLERDLTTTERQASLSARVAEVLAGKLKPANAAETLGFAQLCYHKKLHGASARLWAEAFGAQPKLADDLPAQHRYNAACAAALAGCGQGKEDPPLDEATRARWRKQALDWLKADLAAWSKVVGSGSPQARSFASQMLHHWKVDHDLAGIRDEAAQAKLPEAEQKACRALWVEVDALLAKARAGTKP
jgi:tetratricopeptide (TPR) repeat protein